MQESSKNSSRGYLIGVSATVLLSTTGILISYLSTAYKLPSLVLAFWRDCFVVFGLVVMFALFSRTRFRLRRSALEIFYFIRLDPIAVQFDVDILGSIQRRGSRDDIGVQFACHNCHPVIFAF